MERNVTTGHTLIYAGKMTEVDAYLIRAYGERGTAGWANHRFEDAAEAANFLRSCQIRRLARIGAVIAGRQTMVPPYEAIVPVYDALNAESGEGER